MSLSKVGRPVIDDAVDCHFKTDVQEDILTEIVSRLVG